MKIYAGIGSRKTPKDIIEIMEEIGASLARREWLLRSGGADGADSAFEKGCDVAESNKEIFRSNDAEPWAFEEAKKHIPKNRPPFNTWKPYVQGLIARNMMQILGKNGDEPVRLVICWTPATKDGGGTGYALRCALSHDIPVYNLIEQEISNRFL